MVQASPSTRNKSHRTIFESQIRGRKMETRYRDQGPHISYNLSSTFMVQAIAHVFNGASSSTRTIQDLNEEEYDREKAEGSDKPVQDNASISAQKEMNSIFIEALDCHDCNIQVTREALIADVVSGTYNPMLDPPFLDMIEEDVSPLDQPVLRRQSAGYMALVTSSQIERYADQVHRCLKNLSSRRNSDTDATVRNHPDKMDLDDGREYSEADFELAIYCINFHIHQHYLARRGVLNFCRTNEEVEDFKEWSLEIRRVDRKLARLAAKKEAGEEERKRQQNLQPSQLDKQYQTRYPFPDELEDVEMDSPPSEAPEVPERPEDPMILGPAPTPPEAQMPTPLPTRSSSTVHEQLHRSFHYSCPHPISKPTLDAYHQDYTGQQNNTPPTTPPPPQPLFQSSSPPSSYADYKTPQGMNWFLFHQENIWRKRTKARSQRLHAAIKKFAAIMRERESQREDGLKIAKYHAAVAEMECLRTRNGPRIVEREPVVKNLLDSMNR